MKRFAIALTLASSLALPATALRAQQSSDSESQRSEQSEQSRQRESQQSQQSQQAQQRQQRQQQQSQSSQRQQSSQQDSQRQSQAPQSQQQPGQNVVLEGRVVDADTLQLQGHDYRHVFATVRSDHSGRTFLVDLGTQRELSDIEAQPGQQISVVGRMGSFRDSPVIIARQVEQGNNSVSISRTGEGNDAVGQSFQQQAQDCPLCAAKSMNEQRQQQPQQSQQQRQQSQQQRRQQQQRQTAQSQQQQQQSISGKLIDARSIQLRGQQDRHVLARIRTDDGRTIIADLGPRRNLRNIQPTRGSEIEITGRRGTINYRPVILAQRVSTGDETVNIQRSSQSSQQTRQQQQQRQRQQSQQQTAQLQDRQGQTGAVQGQLVSTVAMDFGAQSPTFIVGTLETQGGQRVLVDLGTLQDLQDAQLRLGEDLRARGRITQLNGVPVVIAREIVDDGQTISIDRSSPDMEQTVQSSQSGSQSSPTDRPSSSQSQRTQRSGSDSSDAQRQ